MGIRVPRDLLKKLRKSAHTTLQGSIAQTDKQNDFVFLLKQPGIKSITVDRDRAFSTDKEKRAYVSELTAHMRLEHQIIEEKHLLMERDLESNASKLRLVRTRLLSAPLCLRTLTQTL